ncbi:efflux RND transporter periplasmic adaptor subunit [Hyphobacterium sp. CCMP332]|nr:efflux RND transporter periplasmic adaptor subunit [Hyphobacterium sp. CCMP332]
MRTFLIIIVVVLLFGSFIGGGYYLYQKSEEKPVVYEIQKPFFSDVVKKTVATGSIIPRKEIEIKSQVSGVVDKLFVEAGEQVRTGQIIARIKIIPNVVALNNAEANLKTAIINFKNSEKELKRQQDLFEQKVISEFDYNQFLLDYNLRKQQVEAAENNLDLIKEGAAKKSGNVSNLVKSTVEGMVLDVPVKEGNFVIETNTFNDGTTIAFIANMSEMIFEGNVDETEVGKIKEGMDLILKIGALESESFKAKLEYISPKGVEEEGAIQFEIRAAVKLEEGKFLRAGYSANADIVLDKRDSVLVVPERILSFKDGKTYVEIQTSEQEFKEQAVKVGLSDGINIEVIEGVSIEDQLKAGEKI